MQIREAEVWHQFYVPIPGKDGETEEQYLDRTRACLSAFYERYTMTPPDIRDAHNPLHLDMFPPLTEEWNFTDLHLDGIEFCDVKFSVGTPEDISSVVQDRVGINIWSHDNRPEERMTKMDFLKKKWTEFDYQP